MRKKVVKLQLISNKYKTKHNNNKQWKAEKKQKPTKTRKNKEAIKRRKLKGHCTTAPRESRGKIFNYRVNNYSRIQFLGLNSILNRFITFKF